MDNNVILSRNRQKDCRLMSIQPGDIIVVESLTMGAVKAKVIGIYKHHVLVEYSGKKGNIRTSVNYGSLYRMGY